MTSAKRMEINLITTSCWCHRNRWTCRLRTCWPSHGWRRRWLPRSWVSTVGSMTLLRALSKCGTLMSPSPTPRNSRLPTSKILDRKTTPRGLASLDVVAHMRSEIKFSSDRRWFRSLPPGANDVFTGMVIKFCLMPQGKHSWSLAFHEHRVAIYL